jgi:hypothetical protein
LELGGKIAGAAIVVWMDKPITEQLKRQPVALPLNLDNASPLIMPCGGSSKQYRK